PSSTPFDSTTTLRNFWKRSTFDTGERDPANDQALTDAERDDHRQGSDNRGCHELVPLGAVLLDKHGEPELNGAHVVSVGNQQWPQKRIPTSVKAEYRQRGNPRHRQPQHAPPDDGRLASRV